MTSLEHFAAALQAGGLVMPHPGLSLPQAYQVAALRHRLRLAAGERPIGRKIGHTNPANWPAQGLSAPTWGWLYASSTEAPGERLRISAWREPKVELECVLRLSRTPASSDELPDCVDAMAMGLEIVDRPYPSWAIGVPDSVAAGGVHAGLRVGPWLPLDSAVLPALQAELQVGAARSEGGSAGVFGNPLSALARLMDVLAEQGAPPLQAGEWVTTGALAPALPLRAGEPLWAQAAGLGTLSLRVV
ncbi:2-keto-4-pentenoate hydratase [Inhella gelatinilytica]|uniref:Fumarylacetoacetate hydrolase family protein n=1 Tax=Inhella gelatinilytica TaxID=2795030 RepID=A0A931IX51_9BURK|nr:fumarylacetoacetate hydrolase family protein [Inhella gelatinilytica]MBH9553779.1 fumarylacetoacetate hydrolase family protein [Inhella gelatinilytica]